MPFDMRCVLCCSLGISEHPVAAVVHLAGRLLITSAPTQ
jgi:hypothetical protein